MPRYSKLRLQRRTRDFCRQRLAEVLPPRDVGKIEAYLVNRIKDGLWPPRAGAGFDWIALARESGVDLDVLRPATTALRPLLAALVRHMPAEARVRRPRAEVKPASPQRPVNDNEITQRRPARVRVGPAPRLSPAEVRALAGEAPFDGASIAFCDALDFQMRRNGDNAVALHHAVVRPGEVFDRKTITTWRRGTRAPRAAESFEILGRIEHRYGLPPGYFKAKLPHPSRSVAGRPLADIGRAERRRIAWHLPDDFDYRSGEEQERILEWVRRVVVSGATGYRRFQANAMKHRYALRFPEAVLAMGANRPSGAKPARSCLATPHPRDASPTLIAEMTAFVRFKTATLSLAGYRRSGVWNAETAAQRVEHLSLLLGALTAAPDSAVQGLGAPLRDLTLALLVFPATWDWYVQWRERRRGFYTSWEADMLGMAIAITRAETGWLRQSPELASRLKPVAGLVSEEDVANAQADWGAACDALHKHAMARAREIERIARVHRDPFEAILPILEAPSPLGEYRKITDEILRLMPDERRYPRAAAEAVRSFLMLRLGLHLGLRQKNLRQLLLCERGRTPTSERRLEDLKRGELRWSDRDGGWEVLVPAAAFKNAHSSFFGSKPFRLILPDLAGLYDHLDGYIHRHRARLLWIAADPGTLFVKTAKRTSTSAEYDQTTFYEAWRWTIQRYGIFNPYTGRGAIAGLLPHGPHNLRDVLATHILKQTGSYEQASYAIQDTPEMVAQHYGRFLPQDKAELAAQVLNKVWGS